MAIRFQCAACSEPIEVDDEWGRQVVRCPYCQRTVTAPAESTLPSNDQIPVATAIAGRREFMVPADPVGAGGAVPPFPPRPQTNRAAATALILAFTAIGLLLLAIQTMSHHPLEMEEFQRIVSEARSTGGSTMTAMMKYFEKQGGQVPGWMVALNLFGLASMAAWLGSVVFGILGLFRPIRRGMAVAALVIAGMLSALFCLSALGGVAA